MRVCKWSGFCVCLCCPGQSSTSVSPSGGLRSKQQKYTSPDFCSKGVLLSFAGLFRSSSGLHQQQLLQAWSHPAEAVLWRAHSAPARGSWPLANAATESLQRHWHVTKPADADEQAASLTLQCNAATADRRRMSEMPDCAHQLPPAILARQLQPGCGLPSALCPTLWPLRRHA